MSLLNKLFVTSIVFLGITLSSLSADECVIYDYDNSFIDQWGFMILRFYNTCEEKKEVSLLIRNERGESRSYNKWIAPGKAVEINIGQNVPHQTFYWSSDGSSSHDR